MEESNLSSKHIYPRQLVVVIISDHLRVGLASSFPSTLVPAGYAWCCSRQPMRIPKVTTVTTQNCWTLSQVLAKVGNSFSTLAAFLVKVMAAIYASRFGNPLKPCLGAVMEPGRWSRMDQWMLRFFQEFEGLLLRMCKFYRSSSLIKRSLPVDGKGRVGQGSSRPYATGCCSWLTLPFCRTRSMKKPQAGGWTFTRSESES